MHIYLSYSEDILATHANAGLVRRAKKSLDQVQMVSNESAEVWQFSCEEYTVSLPASGIQDAHCTCTAHECCKHILSSILWLQQQPELLQAHTEQTPAASTNEPSALESALALECATLLKKSKKADRLLAFQITSDWQQQPETCRIEIDTATIAFHTPFSSSPIRFFAQTGLAGMVSDVPDKQKAACHLACLAYLFSQHAPAAWQWTDDVQAWQAQQTSSHSPLTTDDRALIHELQGMTLSFVRQGLAHLAQESVLALHLLNMQARAQSLPRLASELRRVHGLLKKQLDDDIQVDEQHILTELARFYHYLYALDHADDTQLPVLKGQKRDYQAQDLPNLIPLGCEWWHASSGALGLTACFWDGEAQCLREVTQARANALDTTFTMDSAAQTGIWGSSLSFLMAHRLHLSQTKLTETGQISPASDVRIMHSEKINAYHIADFRAAVPAISDWQQLNTILRPQSLLTYSLPRYLFLYPHTCQELSLNEWEQRFETLIADEHEQLLRLSIPIQTHQQRKIDKFDVLLKREKIHAILVRVLSEGQSIELMPCSVLLEHHGKLEIFNLDFDYLPRPPKKTLFELIQGRIAKMQAQKKHQQIAQHNITPLDYALQQMQALLEFYANTGRQQFDDGDAAQWQEIMAKLDAMGMTSLPKTLNPAQEDFAEFLLKARYLLLALQQLQVKLPLVLAP